MMKSFDRYLRVLRFFLPREERDDIISELVEEYRSQVAATEQARGRSLTDAERAAIVRQFGHPIATAARYWRQQHLIGPALFPFYWPAAAALLLLNLTLHAASAAVAFGLRQSMAEVFAIVNDLVPSTFTIIGVVTVLFAVLERTRGRRAFAATVGRVVHSSIAGVRPVVAMTEATMRPLKRGHRDDGASDGGDRSVAGLVTSLVFVGWWLLALRIPSLMFLTAGEQLAWAPAMDRIYPAIVAANLLFLASECLRYTPRRHSSLTRRIATAAVLADAVFLFLMITSDYHWVRWQGGSLAGREADIVRLVNVVLTAVMLAVAFGVMRRWLLALARRFTTHPPKAALASGR